MRWDVWFSYNYVRLFSNVVSVVTWNYPLSTLLCSVRSHQICGCVSSLSERGIALLPAHCSDYPGIYILPKFSVLGDYIFPSLRNGTTVFPRLDSLCFRMFISLLCIRTTRVSLIVGLIMCVCSRLRLVECCSGIRLYPFFFAFWVTLLIVAECLD